MILPGPDAVLSQPCIAAYPEITFLVHRNGVEQCIARAAEKFFQPIAGSIQFVEGTTVVQVSETFVMRNGIHTACDLHTFFFIYYAYFLRTDVIPVSMSCQQKYAARFVPVDIDRHTAIVNILFEVGMVDR